jgi:hypothetical protein
MVAAFELYFGCRLVVLGLHAETHEPLVRFPVPTPKRKALARKLRNVQWGAWPTVNRHNVTAYRLVHTDRAIRVVDDDDLKT